MLGMETFKFNILSHNIRFFFVKRLIQKQAFVMSDFMKQKNVLSQRTGNF